MTIEELQQNGLVDSAAQNIQTWLSDPLYASFTDELTTLMEAGDVNALNDAFYQVIPFGTGGRRGRMGIGTNRINEYTIGVSAQGFAEYLIAHFGEQEVKTRGMVVTYDVRHNSERFAKAAASVFAANGIKVFFFDDVRSTPQISFTIRFKKAIGGAMISASHNPPTDNGIKIYWETGGQLLPPHDQNTIDTVNAVKEIKTGDFETFVASGQIEMMDEAADIAYHDAVGDLSLGQYRDATIVFTPMHGVATSSFLPVLKRVGFNNIVELESQMNPDADFTHVKDQTPNPEVPQSLDLAVEKAKEVNADIVLAADPDADRIGVVSRKYLDSNEYVFLNGNQIGVLLLDYITQERDCSGGVVVKTVVTTDLISAIAKANSIHVISDLPVGFKYIGDAIEERLAGREFIFGAEESHGYLYGDYARDKDGAIAALFISEYASKLKQQGHTLYEQLERIKKKYGYYRELLQAVFYHGMDGMDKMLGIMDSLRQDLPTEIGGLQVHAILDQEQKVWLDGQTGEKTEEYVGFPNNALVFYLNEDHSIRVVVRPSGTEPKIKFYAAVGLPVGEEKSAEEYEAIKKQADELAHKILEWMVSRAESVADGGERYQVLG